MPGKEYYCVTISLTVHQRARKALRRELNRVFPAWKYNWVSTGDVIRSTGTGVLQVQEFDTELERTLNRGGVPVSARTCIRRPLGIAYAGAEEADE